MQVIRIEDNLITQLPPSFTNLAKLRILKIVGNPLTIPSEGKKKSKIASFYEYKKFINFFEQYFAKFSFFRKKIPRCIK
jgi:hypothetical protein